jgi:predicted RNA-binding Zn-ribbon protein involved in translation (DUF1610 family)
VVEIGVNTWHCPVCGLDTEFDGSDFSGDEVFVCPNGHSITYHFPGGGNPSSFDCPVCGKTHIVYDEFEQYPVSYAMDFGWAGMTGYYINHWGM